MPNAEHDEILELIPAYALNSLDADEAAIVDQHLPDCETCQAELATYEAVVDVLPLAAPDATPSPDLKERLMARVKTVPDAETAAAVPQPPPEAELSGWQSFREAMRNFLAGPRWRPAVLLLFIALVVSNILLWQQLNEPSPNAWRRISLTGSGVAPEATGIIYISADGQKGTLIVDRLPQLNPEQQYQLWLIQDGQRTSGGVFSVDTDGYRGIEIESLQPLQDFDAFGVTIEPAGGSPGPTGERVLGSNL
jgi:anti-sigma-K factor RskA